MQHTSQAHQPATSQPAAQREARPGGASLSAQLAHSPRQAAQRRQLHDLRAEPVQRIDWLEEEADEAGAAQLRADPVQRQDNRTGMPDGLKAGIESLSGMDISDVRVHRNSSQPAQLNALAYAQGNDIHLGPGQEQHLPHETWHVVQQRQGRVQATMQMAGVGVNDDQGLEREADVMGERAVQMRREGGESQDLTPNLSILGEAAQSTGKPAQQEPLQGRYQIAQRQGTKGVRAADAARPPRLADLGTDARDVLQRVTAPSTPVIQRFQLRKWHVTEQLALAKLLGGDGPWETDSLNLETKRQLHLLLSLDSKFSSRTADLEQLKKSFESPQQPSIAKEGLPQIEPELINTGVSTPHVHNPAKMGTSPLVFIPSPRTTPETSATPLKPQNAPPERLAPEQDKTTRRPFQSSPLSATKPEKQPSSAITPDLSPEQRTDLQETGPVKLEAIEAANNLPHKVRVARAMATIPKGKETSEETVMDVLITEYGSAQALVEPSRTPEFASALLESIRLLQSHAWATATAMVKPNSSKVLPGKIEDWTIRHYTNKATVKLGATGENGRRKVIAVDTPPFNELLSMVTLTAMRMHGMVNYPLGLAFDQRLHTNSSSKNSGHTSALDWKNIGNIGDTFYALFYQGKTATGVVPAFINDALYYAEWKISDFGEGWASSDWLSTASGSKEETAKRPSGMAVEGPLEQVIAHQLGFTKMQSKNMDSEAVARNTKSTLQANFENFEVKKHGSLKLQPGSWKPANPAKIEEIKSGWYDDKDNWTKES